MGKNCFVKMKCSDAVTLSRYQIRRGVDIRSDLGNQLTNKAKCFDTHSLIHSVVCLMTGP